MKQVISIRDLEEMVRNGKDVRSLPAEALLTPSARDFLREIEASDHPRARAANGAKNVRAGHAREFQEFED